MLNSVIIMGRITADPELRTTTSGLSVTSFNVAVDRRVKSGEEKKTDFISVVAWRQTADFVTRFFKKGQMIAVQGSLQVENYEDKNGNKRTSYNVVADNVSFCGSKSENAQQKAEPKAQKQPTPYDLEHNPNFEPDFSVIDDNEDGLPF